MPLVSGVCRKASAPTLSHGGSRLNASKPEANPKTRCPLFNTHNSQFRIAKCVEVNFLRITGILQNTRATFPQSTDSVCLNLLHTKHINRIAIQETVGTAHLEGAKYLQDHKRLHTKSKITQTRLRNMEPRVSHPSTHSHGRRCAVEEQKTTNTHYVPLQTREHAWAGMSGMLRFGGARGAFYVPRR